MNTSGSTKTITRAVQVTLQIAYDHWLRTGGPIKPADLYLLLLEVEAMRQPETKDGNGNG